MDPHEITPEKIRLTLEHRLPRRSTSSSVLVPLIDKSDGWNVLFEVRSNTVSQPGEVSFPGGHLMHEESSLEAVLRETSEETGIKPDDIEILGGLPRERIQGGRLVRPFVGCLPSASLQTMTISDEVASLFTVPIDYLMSVRPQKIKYRMSIPEDKSLPPILQRHLSVENPYGVTFYWEYRGYGIWGLTARILYNLLYLIYNYKI